jgi:putative endonuclease
MNVRWPGVRRILVRLGLARPVSLRDPLGPIGERMAARLLRRSGYRVLKRNVRIKGGEADLVCLAPDRRTIVIVEVKTRRRGASGSILSETVAPEASVHAHKRANLARIARVLAKINGWSDRPLRIDVVAVEWPAAGRSRPVVRHWVDAVPVGAIRP